MSQYGAYVYCWTDVKTKRLYIGKHKGSLDDGYICSSKYFLSEYKKRPEEFIRTIIATEKNPKAVSVEYNGIKFETMKELKDQFGFTMRKIRNMIASGEVKRV
jgi:hypothetical protein